MTYKNYKTQILKDERSSKLNFEIDGRTHFVYRISQIKLKEYYYGSKTGELRVLETKYLSTSTNEDFIKDQEENPQNYKYKVIRVFDNPADKMIFEAYLHQKFNVKENNIFYNKANQTPFGFDTTGKTHSEEWKNNKRESMTGINNHNYGIKLSKERKQSLRESNTGMNHPNSLIIHIFDNNGNIKFICEGNFKYICRDNKLPHVALSKSYKNEGEPLYIHTPKKYIQRIINRGNFI